MQRNYRIYPRECERSVLLKEQRKGKGEQESQRKKPDNIRKLYTAEERPALVS